MPTLKIATFNAENLFSRPRAMLHTTWGPGSQALEDFAEMSRLIEELTYTPAIKSRLRTLINRQLFDKPAADRVIKLNEARDRLVKRVGTTTTIVANGRAGWVGWFEMIRDQLAGVEVLNTGRVIHAVRPDILCLVEVEDLQAPSAQAPTGIDRSSTTSCFRRRFGPKCRPSGWSGGGSGLRTRSLISPRSPAR